MAEEEYKVLVKGKPNEEIRKMVSELDKEFPINYAEVVVDETDDETVICITGPCGNEQELRGDITQAKIETCLQGICPVDGQPEPEGVKLGEALEEAVEEPEPVEPIKEKPPPRPEEPEPEPEIEHEVDDIGEEQGE